MDFRYFWWFFVRLRTLGWLVKNLITDYRHQKPRSTTKFYQVRAATHFLCFRFQICKTNPKFQKYITRERTSILQERVFLKNISKMMIFRFLEAWEMVLERQCHWEVIWAPRASVQRVVLVWEAFGFEKAKISQMSRVEPPVPWTSDLFCI